MAVRSGGGQVGWGGDGAMRVVGFVPDLMDRSRVSAVLPATSFVSQPARLPDAVGEGDLALVDLGRPGALEALPDVVATGARVVAFGAHVERDLLESARAAGCREVLARSAFFRTLGDLAARQGRTRE